MCGRNAEFQLGISTNDPGNSLRLNERSHLFQPTFMPISTGDLMLPKKAKDIVCGGEHTLVILENGVEVVGMGTSSDGQLFDSSYAQALPVPTFLSYFKQEHRKIVQMSAAYHTTACVVEAFRQPYSLRKLCSDVILEQYSELTEWLLHPEQVVKQDEDDADKQYYRNLLSEHFC